MNSQILKRTVQIAQAMSPTNREFRTSHVAFLVKSGKITNIGWNKKRTHTITKGHPYREGIVGLHAEVSACIKSGKEDRSNYEMVVVRIDRNNKVCNSRPCKGCHSILKQFNIGNVWSSNKNGEISKAA